MTNVWDRGTTVANSQTAKSNFRTIFEKKKRMSSPDQIRMEDIEKKMKEFKQNHEHALLKSKDNPFNSNYDKRNTFDTSSILKLLNVECVIVPVAFNLSSINCQYALVANYLSNSAEIGFIEAHGGLWKLIQRKDGIPGVRVILQAAVSDCRETRTIEKFLSFPVVYRKLAKAHYI